MSEDLMRELSIPSGRLLRPVGKEIVQKRVDKFPGKAHPRKFSFWRRLVGPIHSRSGRKLGLFRRLLYENIVSDDQYYDQIDLELKAKGL